MTLRIFTWGGVYREHWESTCVQQMTRSSKKWWEGIGGCKFTQQCHVTYIPPAAGRLSQQRNFSDPQGNHDRAASMSKPCTYSLKLSMSTRRLGHGQTTWTTATIPQKRAHQDTQKALMLASSGESEAQCGDSSMCRTHLARFHSDFHRHWSNSTTCKGNPPSACLPVPQPLLCIQKIKDGSLGPLWLQ
eukprot:6061526-Amphidinium_carterae.1